MIGLDTNIIVRYITQDDPEQAARANEVMESLTEDDPGFVSVATVIEVYWVLRSAYKASREQCARAVAGLLDAPELLVGESDVIRRALGRIDGQLDFADALIAELGRAAGCSHTITFDRRAARLPGMRLVAADN